jgi:hypothetical protein
LAARLRDLGAAVVSVIQISSTRLQLWGPRGKRAFRPTP